MAVTKLVLLRHGESTWNKENKFTGWTDVDLSDKGRIEAGAAGDVLKSEGYTFDVAYTSVLKRAIRTLAIVLEKLDLNRIPVHQSWLLNERHYGALHQIHFGVGMIANCITLQSSTTNRPSRRWRSSASVRLLSFPLDFSRSFSFPVRISRQLS